MLSLERKSPIAPVNSGDAKKSWRWQVRPRVRAWVRVSTAAAAVVALRFDVPWRFRAQLWSLLLLGGKAEVRCVES